jgi:polysaccharide biosynthesis transport protein
MNIIQFLRIFWARRMIVLVAIVTSFLGAYVVTLLVQPRYEATSRVMMDILRPDPITGEVIGRAAGTYFENQMELVSDYSVTGPVVDAMGWLSDPGQIRAYQARGSGDTRDFRRWLAQNVADNSQAKVNGTVLEITYRSTIPTAARVGAETLRQSFLNASLVQRRADASKSAAFYVQQAENARKLAENAELSKAAYEKETGIIMDHGQADMESERLTALAGQAAMGSQPTFAGGGSAGGSSAAMELAQIDAKLAELGEKLGPNHPDILELRARRATVAKLAQEESKTARSASSGADNMAVISHALEEQKSKVIAQRDKVEHLRQLQGEVELRQEQYRSAAAKAAQYSLEASAVDNGMTPIGVVVTPSKPVFPNKPLMVGGAVALGTALGLAVALLLELLNRRVRGVEDLHLTSEIPCICVVEAPRAHGRRFSFARAFGLPPPPTPLGGSA